MTPELSQAYAAAEIATEKVARLTERVRELEDVADIALGVLIDCCVAAGGVDDRKAMLDAQAQLRAALAKREGG